MNDRFSLGEMLREDAEDRSENHGISERPWGDTDLYRHRSTNELDQIIRTFGEGPLPHQRNWSSSLGYRGHNHHFVNNDRAQPPENVRSIQEEPASRDHSTPPSSNTSRANRPSHDSDRNAADGGVPKRSSLGRRLLRIKGNNIFTRLFRRARPERQRTGKTRPRRLVCTACTEFTPEPSTVTLPCRHVYCHTCVIALFQNALRNYGRMPLTCCGEEIPSGDDSEVRGFLPETLYRAYVTRLVEVTTVNPRYCYKKTCSSLLTVHDEFDPPRGHCQSCGRWSCLQCDRRAHARRDCRPSSPHRQVLEIATQNKWKQCPNCRQMVELHSGCIHIRY